MELNCDKKEQIIKILNKLRDNIRFLNLKEKQERFIINCLEFCKQMFIFEDFIRINNYDSTLYFTFNIKDKIANGKNITIDIIMIKINGEKLDLSKIFDKEEEKYYNIPKQMLQCMSSLGIFRKLVSDRYEAFKRGETLFHINSFEAFGLYFDDRGRTLVKHTSGDMCNITPLLINMNEKNNVCFKCNTVFTLEDILSLNLSLETKTTKQYYNNFSTEQPIGTILIHTTCPNISK